MEFEMMKENAGSVSASAGDESSMVGDTESHGAPGTGHG